MTSVITQELLGSSIIYLSRKNMKGPNVFMTEKKQVSRKRNTIFYGLSQYAQASRVKRKPLHKIHHNYSFIIAVLPQKYKREN